MGTGRDGSGAGGSAESPSGKPEGKKIELGVAGAAVGHEAVGRCVERSCPICYDDFREDQGREAQGVAKSTFSCPCCRVMMHKNCVRRWFQAQRELRSHTKQEDLGSCPTCRYPINWDVIIPNVDRKSNKVKPEGEAEDGGALRAVGDGGIGGVPVWEPAGARHGGGARSRAAPPSNARVVQHIDDDTAAGGCVPWSWSSWSWWGSTRTRRVHVS